jgi:hypothetical protein
MRIAIEKLRMLPPEQGSRNVATCNVVFGGVLIVRNCLIAAREDGAAFVMFPRNHKGDRTAFSVQSVALFDEINAAAFKAILAAGLSEQWTQACRVAAARRDAAIAQRAARLVAAE